MHSVIVLIPSYNDYKGLKKIIFEIKKKYKVIIINDNSTDKTKKLLLENKIINIKNKKNLGYEKSLIKGFEFIKKKKFQEKYILTMDADGEHSTKNIKIIYNLIEKVNADLLIGSRSKQNRILEYFISFLTFKFFRLVDPLSGFKIYKTRSIFQVLKNVRNDLFLVDLITLFLRKKFKINYTIFKNQKIIKRKSTLGGSFYLSLKFLNIAKLIIYEFYFHSFFNKSK